MNDPLKSAFSWSKRRTGIGGSFADHDWIITRSGLDVGRIVKAHRGDGGTDWIWASWVTPASNGRAETARAAFAQLQAAITQK